MTNKRKMRWNREDGEKEEEGMTPMTPTNKLRFVRRPEFEPDGPPFIRVLQQWWEDQSTDVNWVHGNPGEWRDVPLEVEE